MTKRIYFAQFDAFMASVGFRITVVPRSHVNYYHEESDTLLPIRLHKPTDFVPDYWIASARGQLDRRGILDAKDFEEKLNAVAA